MFARAQLAKEAEQTRHGTHPTVATALIMGTSGSEMLLLIFFFLLSLLNQINIAITGVLNDISWKVFMISETI